MTVAIKATVDGESIKSGVWEPYYAAMSRESLEVVQKMLNHAAKLLDDDLEMTDTQLEADLQRSEVWYVIPHMADRDQPENEIYGKMADLASFFVGDPDDLKHYISRTGDMVICLRN